MKYHIKKDGTPGVCHAENGKCPLGGDSGTENHFNSEAEAQTFIDNKNANIFANEQDLHKEELTNKITELSSRVDAITNNLEARKNDKEFVGSDEWFNNIQERKALFYDKLSNEKELAGINNEEFHTPNVWDTSLNNWHSDPNYQFHPEISHDNEWMVKQARTALQSYTGYDDEKLDGLLKEKEDKGLSLDQSYKEIYNEAHLRTDKNIVAIDLETANPIFAGNKIDRGPYSDIVEIGWHVQRPDGNNEEHDYLNKTSPELGKILGMGQESVHHISADMVKDRPTFVADKKTQEKVLNELKGNVLLAHNAQFEINQLSNNLRGFKKAYDNGEIEILDTMHISKYYTPESARNSNEAFVEAAGLKYEGAHRALTDAKMSLNAMTINKEHNQK